TATPPVEVGGSGVVGQRPDDEAAHLPRVELVPAGLEQALAEAQALMRRRDVDLVDLALVLAAHARRAERRIAGDLAAYLQHEHAVSGFDRRRPPVGAAAADHALEVRMRNNAEVGLTPRLAEHLAQCGCVRE